MMMSEGFRHNFFPPVEFPLVEHETWVERSYTYSLRAVERVLQDHKEED
jgi:hypothetical protein